jgi:hypothetical protein
VPPYLYGATIRFYRDAAGLKLLETQLPSLMQAKLKGNPSES